MSKPILGLNKIKSFLKRVVAHPDYACLAVLCLLSLTPLLWYGPKEMALGHDMGFPLDPISWAGGRFFSWNERYSLGTDQSTLMASVVLHNLEALLYILTQNVALGQRLLFILFFALPGFAMYALLRNIFSAKQKYFALMGAIMYMFNLFFLQAWFIAERNKFAILTALPLTVLVMLKVLRDRYAILNGAIIISLIFMILSGGGSLPLYGTVLTIVPFTWIAFTGAYAKNKSDIFRSFKFIILVGVLFLIANAFWILPQLFVIRTGFEAGVEVAGGRDAVKLWVTEISRNAHYVDLLRMQGFPDWGENHNYSSLYTSNALLILVSFAFILLSILGVYKAESRKRKFFGFYFFCILLIEVFFSAGNQGFLGGSYNWMLDHIPLFVVFRTPFYKFGGGIVFAFSYLVPAGTAVLFRYLKTMNNKLTKDSIKLQALSYIEKVAAIVLLIVYVFPFLTGSFFDWNKPVSTMVEVPEYIFEYGDYVKRNSAHNPNGRTLVVPPLDPDNKIDVTDWNFFSLDTVPSLISAKPHLTSSVSSSLSRNTNQLLAILYAEMETNDNPELIEQLMFILGVDSVLLRMDVKDFRNINIDDPAEWQKQLDRSIFLRKEREFGKKWALYEYNGRDGFEGTYSNVQLVNAGVGTIPDLYGLNIFNAKSNPSIFRDEETKGLDIQKLKDDEVLNREVIVLNSEDAEIEKGKLNYDKSAFFEQYKVVTKSLDITELWYKLSATRVGNLYTIYIQRPETEITIGDQKITTKPRTQTYSFGSEKIVDRVVINADVVPLPGDLNAEPRLLTYIQPGKQQLNIAYGYSYEGYYPAGALFDPSFEISRWEGIQICGGIVSARNISINKTTDRTNGEFAISIGSRGPTTVCLIQAIKGINRASIYRLSFDYKNSSGYPLRYCVLKRYAVGTGVQDRGCIKEGVVTKSDQWQTYTTEFSPSDASEHILHFYTESGQGLESTNLIDNVSVYEIPTSSIGSFVLDTGIEGSQFFNIPAQSFEEVGKLKLQAENKVSIYTAGGNITNSYIRDRSLESENAWAGVNFCGGDPNSALVDLKRSEDKTDGKYSARLEAENGIACLYTTVENFRPSLSYKISFDYKNIKGEAPGFCALVRTKSAAECAVSVDLPKSKEWQSYSTVINTNKDSIGIVPHLYSPAVDGATSINLFDNVRLEVVYNPYEAIYIISTDRQSKEDAKNKVSMEKIFPTNYSLEAKKNDYSVVTSLNVTYSPYWRMTSSPKNDGDWLKYPFKEGSDLARGFVYGSVPEEIEHYPLNGIENGWLLKGDKSGKYSINYIPQQVFILGSTVTIIYLVSLLIRYYLMRQRGSKLKQ